MRLYMYGDSRGCGRRQTGSRQKFGDFLHYICSEGGWNLLNLLSMGSIRLPNEKKRWRLSGLVPSFDW